MASEEKSIGSIKLELKEIITLITLIVSIVVGYLTIIKDFETRLVRLETRFEESLKVKSFNNSMNDPINQVPVE